MDHEPIPISIVQAICQIQGQMEAVKKDTRNQHGNYNYASTDAIYAELTRRLAACGLAIIALEDQPVEIIKVESKDSKSGEMKTSQWGKFVFSFILATSEATWSDSKFRRSMMIQITGPQTFMAAQSYAEKSLLRSLFKIPTGDMDLDSVVQADTLEDQAALNGNGKRKSSSAAKKDGTDKEFSAFLSAVKAAPNSEVLHGIVKEKAGLYRELPDRWRDMIDDEISARNDDLRSQEFNS